jgi:uncharacterized membrane protein
MVSTVGAGDPGGLAGGLADGFDEQAGRRGGDATRHLRAAAHFDRWFRGAAIAELVENRHRIPAPSPGVDSALVLEECLTARRWAVTAACFDLAIGLIALLISVWVVVFAIIVVILLALVLVLIRGITSSFRSNRDSATATLARAGLAMGIGVVVLAIVVFLVIDHLESDGAATGSGLDLTPLVLGTLLVIALWAAVGAVHLYQRQRRLVALLVLPGGPEHVPGAGFPQLKEVFKRLHAREAEAETVYGGFNAFVGAGLEEREEKWSFAVELRPSARYAAENRTPEPLETPDLHDLIHRGLARLGDGPLYPGDLLHRISVRDRLFRSGLHETAPARWYGAFSAMDAETRRRMLTREAVDLLDLGSHERLRHYLEARVELWEQQVVASVFLRIHVQGRLLQMEGLPFVLPPVKALYRTVDEVAPLEAGADAVSAVCSALIGMPGALLASLSDPLAAVASAWRSWTRQNWYRRMLAAGFPVDYGPNTSLRELGAETRYQQRFQEIDVYRFFTSVRKRVATVVLEALREHGFDTAEFEQFVQSININNGIQNYDSQVSAPQAAGAGARAGR